MSPTRKLYDGVFTAVRIGAEVCVFGMIGLLVVDVFGRYVIHKSTLISYDMTGYFLVGITYLGAAYGLREGSHVRVSVLTDRFSPGFQKWWLFCIDLIALLFTTILWWKSVDLVRLSLESGVQASTFMGEPMWVPQILVPIGLGLFVIEEIRGLSMNAKALFFRNVEPKLQSRG